MATQLEERLKHDLFDVTRDVEAPVGFAHDALRSGRRLRRRRTSVLVAGGVAAVVAGVLLVPNLRSGEGPRVTDPTTSEKASTPLSWARSLPKGAAPVLPLFTGEVLRDGDDEVAVPSSVDQSLPPQRVEGGYVVRLRGPFHTIAPAVLSPDGGLRELPAFRASVSTGGPELFPSPDGTRVAYGNRVVDVASGQVTELPHDPAVEEPGAGDYVATLRISGWSDEGLVYDGAPSLEGIGTQWLLRPDGSVVELAGPKWEGVARSYGNGAAGYAMLYDYSDEKDVCTTAFALADGHWQETGSGCMGRDMGEAVDLSPDGRWLLTDDLPEVWNLAEGRWEELDAPKGLLRAGAEGWLGNAGWESDDTFLLPVVDDGAPLSMDPDLAFEQTMQVVRCSMASLSCERAGDELELTLRTDPKTSGTTPAIEFGSY